MKTTRRTFTKWLAWVAAIQSILIGRKPAQARTVRRGLGALGTSTSFVRTHRAEPFVASEPAGAQCGHLLVAICTENLTPSSEWTPVGRQPENGMRLWYVVRGDGPPNLNFAEGPGESFCRMLLVENSHQEAPIVETYEFDLGEGGGRR